MDPNSVIHPGMLLIAEPFMLDPTFARSVILICEHTELGTTGFVLNHPHEYNIQKILEDFPESKATVHIGGPVGQDSLYFLHNVGDLIEGALEVCPGVYWGGDFIKLKFLMENGVVRDENVKFFIGYSGWSKGQLSEELESGDWLVDEMDVNYLFKTKPYVLWQTVLHNKGKNYSVIAQLPNPSLN
jgi:putative transcriptional regulator